MSYLLDSILEGGPGDGAEIAVPEGMEYLLMTLGNQVHGYQLAIATNRSGRWIFRHECEVGSYPTGMSAAEVLRRAGRPCVEIRVKDVPISHLRADHEPQPPTEG